MSSQSTSLINNSIYLYIRTIVQLFISIYSSRLILATLGVEDYGIYNVIGGLVTMFTFVSSALSSGTQRFFAFEIGCNNISKLSLYFSTSRIVYIILAFIFLLFMEGIGVWFLYNKMSIPTERLNTGFWVLQFSIFVMFFNIITIPYNALVIARERFKFFSMISMLEIILKFILIVALSQFVNIDALLFYSLFLLVISFFIRFIYSSYCRNNFRECNFERQFSKSYFKELLSFSSWHFLGAFGQVSKNQGINLLLNIFCGLTVNAAQGIAYQVEALVTNWVSSFSSALNPRMVKAYSSNKTDYFTDLLFGGSKATFILMSIIVLPLIFEADYVLKLWLTEVPQYASIFVKYVLMICLLGAWGGPISFAFNATGKIKKYQLYLTGFNILMLLLSYILLLKYHDPIVIYKMMVVLKILTSISLFYLAYRVVSLNLMKYMKDVLIPLSLITLFVSSILYIISVNFEPSFYRLLFSTITSFVLLVIFSYVFVLNKKERKRVSGICLSLYLKKTNLKS